MPRRSLRRVRSILKRDGAVCHHCGHPIVGRTAYHTMKWKGLDVSGVRPGVLDFYLANREMSQDLQFVRAVCEQCVREPTMLPWVPYNYKEPEANGARSRAIQNAMLRHGERCWMCNRRVLSVNEMRKLRDDGRLDELARYRMATIDHFVPRSAQGRDTLRNRRVACYRCNNLRGHATETDGHDWQTWLPDDFEPMRVLFLDLSGVLHWHNVFVPDAIANLNALTARTEAVVVLSSDWVKRHTMDRPHPFPTVREELVGAGLTADIIGCTFQPPESTIHSRSSEIQDWLDGHPRVSNYAILDDRLLDNMTTEAAQHFVHVQGGWLTAEDAARAARILEAPA